MNREYHKWYSHNLGRDMELLRYGHGGKPVLVFPAQGGRFFESEDFKMIDAISWFINEGIIQVYTVDSVDNESWANQAAHPFDRGRRHEEYDRYITQEVVPFMRNTSGHYKAITTGVSMGGYHSGNFFFRHPDCFDGVISLSGLFQLDLFVGDYMDEVVYYNSPLHFLPNLSDDFVLHQMRESNIIVCCGQGAWEDMMLRDIHALEAILANKGIPAWIDYWGHDVNHDWPWWLKQMPYFLGKLHESGKI